MTEDECDAIVAEIELCTVPAQVWRIEEYLRTWRSEQGDALMDTDDLYYRSIQGAAKLRRQSLFRRTS